MAKKKTSPKTSPESRNRQFKYGNQSTIVPKTTIAADGIVTAPVRAELQTSDGRDFSYVSRDLMNILVIGGGLLVVELVLAYVFVHTGLGAAVYRLVNV